LQSQDLVLEQEVKLRLRNYLLVYLWGSRGASIGVEVRKEEAAPVNQAPTAGGQTVATDEDIPLSIVLTGSDPEADVLTYHVVSAPENGSLSGTAPDLIYRPDPDFYGTDAFTFSVNDGEFDSEAAGVVITVHPVNDPPMAHSQSLTLNEDQGTSVVLLATDVDGDPLTYHIVSYPAHGMLNGAAPNLLYSPSENYNGSDSCSFKVNDGQTDSNIGTISFTVLAVNDSPVADAGIDRKVYVGEVVILDGSGSYDVDIHEGNLTYQWSLALPLGSKAVLMSPETVNPYFVPDVPGNYLIQLVLLDGDNAGDSDTAQIEAEKQPVQVEPQPEGSFGKQYEDLIPHDATVEFYDAKRFSVITGLVQGMDGLPVAGVSVTLLNHMEYGSVRTGEEGRFSITVEGGASFVLIYQKEGLLTVHRKVYVPWNDIAIAETIQMTAQDPVSTTLTFDGNPDSVITHQSTEVSDEFGTRSATMVFTGDNMAYEIDAEGNIIQELTTITTRATEYTTPESMPAILPPNSAYTYCAELCVDGIQRVKFDKPVITWVDNFLGFDVGEIVPVGYYDRDRGVWIPSQNGVVVQLLDTDGDEVVDAYDSDGDGLLEGSVAGLEDAERYRPGRAFWRVELSHFTPWDWNWPFGPPSDAIAPNPSAPPVESGEFSETKDCKSNLGSFVEDRSGVFHEDIAIPGTGMSLHYASNRVQGAKTLVTIPASGERVPQSLKRIIVLMEIVGRGFEQILDPLPEQNAQFVWDGLDWRGNAVRVPSKAQIKIGYVYDGVYYRGSMDGRPSFGEAGVTALGIGIRQDMTIWKRTELEINPVLVDSTRTLGDGWTISKHHYFSPTEPSILRKGNATTLDHNILSICKTIAGNGEGGSSGDGGPASKAQFISCLGLAVDRAGVVYLADYYDSRIRKIDGEGVITTFAGTGYFGHSGDGGPAVEAEIGSPMGLDVDSLGNLYFADREADCVRKVDRNGIIRTVAGNGKEGFSGDNGLAVDASLLCPTDVAVDSEGNLYIADSGNYRIRKVDPGGIITTVAGDGTRYYKGDGSMAIDAGLVWPRKVAVDSAGNLYIAETGRVRKVSPTGVITTLAGNGREGFEGDGGPAVQATFRFIQDLASDASGNLYIADNRNHVIRRIDTYGIITTIAGCEQFKSLGEGGPATEAWLGMPSSVAVDPAGDIYIGSRNLYRIFKVAPAGAFSSLMSGGEVLFVEEDGTAYAMTSSGVHKKTIDLASSVFLHFFEYDKNGRVISIKDQFGRVTNIQRDYEGVPTAIISPDGLTTVLNIDSKNHLTKITHPDGSFYSFEYTDDGLMIAKEEPEGNRFDYVYDLVGRLTDVFDEEQGHWHFERTVNADGDILTTVITGEDEKRYYLDHIWPTETYESTISGPNGAEMFYRRSGDGLTVNKSLPCSVELEFVYDLDPERKFVYAKKMTERTPSGLEKVTLRENDYADTDFDGVHDMITKTVTVNGKATSLQNDSILARKTITSPEGRSFIMDYDPQTLLVTKAAIPGLYETIYNYDEAGRLIAILSGTRETFFAYDATGFLSFVTNPERRTTYYHSDALGRVIRVSRPDGSSVWFSYDSTGNMTILTNPAQIDHTFDYNRVNLSTAYHAPVSGSYEYSYDRDRRLTKMVFPSLRSIKRIYESGGLQQIQTPEGNVDFTYACGSKINGVTRGGESIRYEYDGTLVTSESLSGTVNQVLSYSYSNDFSVQALTYGGGTTTYAYDDDGLLIASGDFGVARNAENGLAEQVSGGALILDREFNGHGEVKEQIAFVAGQEIFSFSVKRDNNGRIVEKTENVGTETAIYNYTYDPLGRVRTVMKNRLFAEDYQYDPDGTGTRIYEQNALRGISARACAYSDEDHLLTAGGAIYEHNLDGFLETKTDDEGVTAYLYSLRGELLRVELPDGTLVEYVYDPLGRRIGKVVDGIVSEKYLWQGLNRLLAVFNKADNLLMRFEYADDRMPMAMSMGGAKYYFAYDQVGSLRVVADGLGAIVKRIDYDSFGNVILDSNPGFWIPFGFAGGLHDCDTGLVRFGFRDYDPDVGRWTAKDPIFFAAGDTDLYGYCLNDPINFMDSIGLAKGDWWDPRTYISISFSGTVVGKGLSKTVGGGQQKTISPLTLVGGSIDISIGVLPGPADTIYEYGLGLGKHLGIGHFFGRQNKEGNFEVGGITFHLGVGLGAPIFFSTTLPDPNRPFSNLMDIELYYDNPCGY
jgi:RHS repeat-associated protein